MLTSILETTTPTVSTADALLCMGAALLLGIVIAIVYMHCGSYSKNFAVTLALLPVLVQSVIFMVNGNLGTSVAVLGTFGLIRFRSVPGTSREIGTIFFAMAVGIAAGMGHLAYAAIFTIMISAAMIALHRVRFGENRNGERQLRVLIPEELDYTEVFNDLFETYMSHVSLEKVKTSNLGTMYELTYSIRMKDWSKEKELIDSIRCRNGNLTVSCGRVKMISEEL